MVLYGRLGTKLTFKLYDIHGPLRQIEYHPQRGTQAWTSTWYQICRKVVTIYVIKHKIKYRLFCPLKRYHGFYFAILFSWSCLVGCPHRICNDSNCQLVYFVMHIIIFMPLFAHQWRQCPGRRASPWCSCLSAGGKPGRGRWRTRTNLHDMRRHFRISFLIISTLIFDCNL